MLTRGTTACMLAGLLAALGAAYDLGAEWDARLTVLPVHGQLLAGQSSGEDDGVGDEGSPRTYQRIANAGAMHSAEYGFENFNRDRLRITYRIPDDVYHQYNAGYGYFPADIKALQDWHQNARQGVYEVALKTGKDQAQLNSALSAIDREYDQKLHAYLASKGFRLEPGNVTRIDMPLIVRHNAVALKPVSQVFDRVASERRYMTLDIVGAGLSFVQTAIHYKEPDDVYKGKHTGGILPPVTTVVLGWGDCDTKTALLASILSNWGQMRMIGLFLPGHYLMGALLIPEHGDVYVEYRGLKYVLLEPAGPAWLPPGRVGEETMAKLNSPDGYKIDPFF